MLTCRLPLVSGNHLPAVGRYRDAVFSRVLEALQEAKDRTAYVEAVSRGWERMDPLSRWQKWEPAEVIEIATDSEHQKH